MSPDFLQRLFSFHSVKIGEPVHFQGGSIKFFYSLHILPCIGTLSAAPRESASTTRPRDTSPTCS